jgi:hypothetical protein
LSDILDDFDWEEQTEKFAEVYDPEHASHQHNDSGFNTAEKSYRTQEVSLTIIIFLYLQGQISKLFYAKSWLSEKHFTLKANPGARTIKPRLNQPAIFIVFVLHML